MEKLRKYLSSQQILFVCGYLLGSVIFFCVYGFQVLNVTNDAWLLNGGDISQNYIGWQYYRNTPWQFPFGLVEGLTYPEKVSVIFTDSITIFAFIFKLLNPILPSTFQYFGIWGIVSYGLMGGISCLLIKNYSDSRWVSLISSSFFVISPYVLQRMFAHTSLGGQWIIVLAIYLWLSQSNEKSVLKKIVVWCSVLGLASLIHIYFIPMVVIFLLCSSLDFYFSSKKIIAALTQFCTPIISTLLILFAMGAFYGSGSMSSDGLGYFSANLNFLINPIFGISKIFRSRECGSGQYEGMGYLGAGILVLVVITLYILLINNCKFRDKIILKEKKLIIGFLACAAFLVLALSPTIMLGNRILFEIPWPDFVIKILSIFRSSGRFVWPICYLILISCFIVILHYTNKRNAIILLCLALMLQIYDLSDNIREKYERFSPEQIWEPLINVEMWEKMLEGRNEIVFAPYDLVFRDADTTFSIAELAYESDIMMNSFYVSRINTDAICPKIDELLYNAKNGQADQEILYVFPSYADVWQEDYALEFYNIDNLCIGSVKTIEGLEDYHIEEKGLSVNMQDLHVTGEMDTDEAKIIKSDRVMYGPYYPLERGTYRIFIHGENLDNLGLILLGDENTQINCELLENTATVVDLRFRIETKIYEFQVQIFGFDYYDRVVDAMIIMEEG